MENKHTISDLWQMQSLPLKAKIQMTRQRICGWVDEYGEDGVYVSFSGGKDSTVLLDIVRKDYPNVKAVFVDTGLEYPEVREFVKTFDNVDWLRPKMNFRQVIDKYGYPFISKEVSECVEAARKYLTRLREQPESLQTDRHYLMHNSIAKSEVLENMPIRMAMLMGMLTKYNQKMENIPSKDRSSFSQEKYKFFLNAPFEISSKCCKVMKKAPIHKYTKDANRMPMTAQMASESRLRTQQWLKNGCNGFDMKSPISNPMAFWTEQDVLLYIYENKLPIASVYGEVVKDYDRMGQLDGQMDMSELSSEFGIFDVGMPLLKTTRCSRTGCMFCGYGCHLEKSPNRFEMMKETHPKQYDYIMRPKEQGGLNYKEVIDWINEHGDMNIKY